MLFINTSKIQNESKSQLGEVEASEDDSCLSIRQRYKMKANHNGDDMIIWYYELFINTSKIQNESKSQRKRNDSYSCKCCLSIRQRYKMKANHNLAMEMNPMFYVVYQYVKDTK